MTKFKLRDFEVVSVTEPNGNPYKHGGGRMNKPIETVAVKIRMTEDFLGTVPKDPKIYKEWIESKKAERINMQGVPGGADVSAEDEAATIAELQAIEAKGWTGFHSDENGLFIYDYMIKGFLKNAGNVMKEALGLKNVRSKIDNYVFVFPRRIYMGQDKPDGVLERPIRVMTMQGPRVALIRSDYIKAGKELDFSLTIVPNPKNEINMDVLMELLGYGTLCGLGQFRNGSYGRFEVLSIDKQ